MLKQNIHNSGDNFKKTIGSQLTNLNFQTQIHRGIKNAATLHETASTQGLYKNSRVPLKRIFSRADLSNKRQIRRALKSCHDLAIGEFKKEIERERQQKKFIEQFKISLTSQELGEILRIRSKETAERDMYRVKNKLPSEIAAEIEFEAVERNKPRNKYPFIDSVEYKMKSLQNNRDDKKYLFPSVDKKITIVLPNYLREKAINAKKHYNEMTGTLHKCLSDMAVRKFSVNDPIKDDTISKEDKRKFYNTLKSGKYEAVFELLDEKPDLINQQFSV